MQTRRAFLTAVGAGLWTLSGARSLAQTPPVPSPVETVTQFLAARAAQDYDKAYALLSADTQKQVSLAQFMDANSFHDIAPHTAEDSVTPQMLAAAALFIDTHNTQGYTFQVIGPDPADPHTVLVNAHLPARSAASASESPTVLRIVTLPYLLGAPRIEMENSLIKTDPVNFLKAREQARMASSMSNMKQIMVAFILYQQDHGLRTPDAARWMDAVMPYMGKQDNANLMNLLHDPSAPDGPPFSYAFNRALSGMLVGDIAVPAETVLLFTSTLGTKNAADTGQSLPKPGWHTGGNLVAFADGHVKWVKDGTPLNFTP